MTARETVRPRGSARDWTVRLDCGHAVTVPWGVAPAFGMALTVHHQENCSEVWRDEAGESAWVPRRSAGVAFR